MRYRHITIDLINILDNNPDIKKELELAIQKADVQIHSIDEYLNFIDDSSNFIPVNLKLLNDQQMIFYYIIDQSKILKHNDIFQKWVYYLTKDWGRFLDSNKSIAHLKNFLNDPAFKINEYAISPSGWMSFNQFFAREIKPGKRPIDSICDESIIVSPVDGVFLGYWNIKNSVAISKGIKISVFDLLDGSIYQSRFANGIFTHIYLDIMDYHRYHTPISGTIKEIRNIPGNVTMDVIKKNDDTLDVVDGEGYQIIQDRGLMILDTIFGMVALIPVGMAQVASVNLTPDNGLYLHKGQEFGFFAFGGSDMIILFENNDIDFTAEKNIHYNQGNKIGQIKQKNSKRNNKRMNIY